MANFCAGCGQPAISATRAGRPVCPDCIDEGYGDDEGVHAPVEDIARLTVPRAEHERVLERIDALALQADEWDGKYQVVSDLNSSLKAELARVREALAWYADRLCEQGPYSELCGKLTDDECAGCRTRKAIGEPT